MPDRPGPRTEISLDWTMLRHKEGGKSSSIPTKEETITEILSSRLPELTNRPLQKQLVMQLSEEAKRATKCKLIWYGAHFLFNRYPNS